MDPELLEVLKERLRVNQLNLSKLELQRDRFGAHCPVHILVEIDEVQARISDLEKRFAAGSPPGRAAEQEPSDQPVTPPDQAWPSGARKRLFCSYAPQDESLFKELDRHLAGLKRQGRIDPWGVSQVKPGQRTKPEIDARLEAADMVVFMLSPDLLSAPFFDEQVAKAMARHARGACRIIPLLVRPADWKHPPLDALQALPRNGKAIALWPSRDSAWLEVVEAFRYLSEA